MPIEQNLGSRFGPELHASQLSGNDSARCTKPAGPPISAVRDFRTSGRVWNDICRIARSDRYAEAQVQQGYEPKDDSYYGYVSNPVDLLWVVDRLAPSGGLECDRGVGQFPQRRRVLQFCPQRKKPDKRVSAFEKFC